jgi:hypothetical protein
MDYWNYRMVKRWDELMKEHVYCLHEVYYTDGEPTSCTVDPVRIVCDDPHDVEVLEAITRAFSEPPLKYKDF